MIDKIKHIIIRSIALLLLFFVVLPSAVKFAHVFENHKHEVCTNPLETHFHEIEIDCEFYKFKLSENKFLVSNDIEIDTKSIYVTLKTEHYISFYNNQQLITFLRGPPLLV